MANEIRIGLGVTGADKAAHDLKKVGNAADNTGDDLKGMAGDAKVLDKAIDDLNSQLVQTRLELSKDPGDKALWKQLRGQEREVNKLTKLRKMVFGDKDAKAAGLQVGKEFGDGIGEALGALPAQLKGTGIALGAGLAMALAPMIGGVIGAAVIGGVGIGGIAGGIAAASQDPRVKAAGEHLGDSLMGSFTGIGTPFIDPLLEQMGRAEGIGAAFFSKLGKDIAPLADHLDELGDGVAGFARNLDLSKAAKAAGPIIDVLGKELPDVADAVTDALDAISQQSDGTVVSLTQLFNTLEDGIRGTGYFVAGLAAINDGITDITETVPGTDGALNVLWSGIAGGMNLVSEETDNYTGAAIRARGPSEDLSEGLKGVGAEAATAAGGLKEVNDAIETLFGQQMSLEEANSRYKNGLRDLRAELTDGKRTLNENTKEGRDNADAIRDQIQLAEDIREKEFARTGDLKASTEAYKARIEQIKAEAIAAGLDAAAVEALVAWWKKVPELVETEHRIKTTFYGGGGSGGEYHQGDKRASGGPVTTNRPYLVGENGPELVTFGANGMVHDAAKTAAMMSGASGGSYGGGGSVAVSVSVRQSESAVMTALATAIIPYLQIEVINQGGDVTTVLGAPER